MQKTRLALIAIILLLAIAQSVNFVSSNFFPQIPPINTVYIRAAGSIEPSTASITIENNVYTLTDDLTNTTLKVERDNIVFDGAGHIISGNDIQFHVGVDLSHRINCTVKNLIIDQFGTGILIDNASGNTLTKNKLSTYQAFSMINADNNSIMGNVATIKGDGIIGTGSFNKITDNNFSLSGDYAFSGISLRSSINNTLSRNNISYGVGINLADSRYNSISNNILVGGTELGSTGILLTRSSSNIVFSNIIKEKSSVSSAAIFFSEECFDNIIFENSFESNTCAVALCYYSVEEARPENVFNNTFYRNSFIENVNNVRIARGTPNNYWDNGQQGNFWSDYQGTDSNNDGVGDAHYLIGENNQDNYPLMTPYDVEYRVVVLSQNEVFLVVLVIAVSAIIAVVTGLLSYHKKYLRKVRQHE